MGHPLLSVVIPTCKRPQFLPGAIYSALQASVNGDVEVIVVPNGLDESWRLVESEFKDEPRVSWHPIERAHANAARNHGMSIAQGRYIRFLDDDDYFYPEAASRQLEDLIEKGADLSFANIESVDERAGRNIVLRQIETSDWCAAVLSPAHATATNAIVYKKEVLEGEAWDVSINKNQDVYWAMSLCGSKELTSIRFDGVVAAWVQHGLPRVSQGHHLNKIAKETSDHVFKLVKSLSSRNLLTEERANYAAEHIWSCAHKGMMYDPLYWIDICRRAETIAPNTRPKTRIHGFPIVRNINPVLVEIFIVPWRWVKKVLGIDGV